MTRPKEAPRRRGAARGGRLPEYVLTEKLIEGAARTPRPAPHAVWFRLLVDRTGASAAEFALILPVMAMLLLGTIKFGIVFNHYIELANAAAAGARQLTINRGSTTPYSSTITAIDNAAPNLKAANITSTLTVNGVACTGDNTTCENAFGNGSSALQAKVSLTYPCNLNVFVLTIPNCNLGSASSGVVQ